MREKKKEEGKRARSDEEEVKAKLFHAFGQHQYYNLKDLVHITNQPIVSLSRRIIIITDSLCS